MTARSFFTARQRNLRRFMTMKPFSTSTAARERSHSASPSMGIKPSLSISKNKPSKTHAKTHETIDSNRRSISTQAIQPISSKNCSTNTPTLAIISSSSTLRDAVFSPPHTDKSCACDKRRSSMSHAILNPSPRI